MTLLSLFDGSGGFCLAALRAGIKPVAASEIEPFPIRVTRRRLPQVKHLGDIRKIDGGKIEPADVVTFGSPCTNLSIAGKRAGLFGEQSSLFFEAVRVIKEMRAATNGAKPRFIIFENVCGVFSSDKGRDFQKILTEIVRIKEPTAPDVPLPEKNERATAGVLLGEGFCVAYRVFDAQFWGVPQRRRRVYLVGDFGGQSAGEILFERDGLQGNFGAGGGAGKNSAAETESGFGKTIGGESLTCVFENHGQDTRYTESGKISQTVSSTFGTGGNNQPLVVSAFDVRLTSDGTRNARSNVYETQISRCLDTGGNYPQSNQGGVAVCGNFASVRRLMPLECSRLQGFPDDWCADLTIENPTDEEIIFWRKVFQDVGKVKTDSQIRRWLKTPPGDSAEYKMWGNGIALPCAEFILRRIAAHVKK